ncbi:hypothetical protein [Desmospora activa]|uniref:Uncharacterized protein n=1 Tax=Desmospora activa DSM 45169 TaxID=1121389 RepID=A0A2T4YZU0_9BACL|nr:hypothetical protein [Desmospora activa]PTM52716.1 hypothetical protein C8J48_3709 [Desmospora activa DSM 45169]
MRRWIGIVGTITLLVGGGVACGGDSFTPAEEHALKFVEAAYIHPDPEKVRPLVNEKLINPEVYNTDGYPPGEVLLGSYSSGVNEKVIVVLPEKYERRVYVELSLGEENGKWFVYNTKKYPGKQSFEEIQEQPEYERWRIDEWKSATID